MSTTTSAPADKDFTAGGIMCLNIKPGGSTGDTELDEHLQSLASIWVQDARQRDLVAGMMMTSLKIGRDATSMADLKMLHRALKEMRYANKVFHPWRQVRKISVFGSARTKPDAPAYQAAEKFARRMVEEGFMVITGAGEGIMGAAQHGAGREKSFGLNIRLPFEQSANETITGDPKLVTFNYFFTRKLSFVKEADAVALFPGGFGTMDEMFESITLMQTGKATLLPVVLVDEPGGTYWKTFLSFVQEHLEGHGLISASDDHLFHLTDDVEEAVRVVVNFYKVFHSYRHVKDRVVFRLKRKLTPAALEKINLEFADLYKEGKLEQSQALPEEAEEEGISHLPRLIGKLKRNDFGRWRLLIDAINAAEVIPAKL
jgi:uncharacterized protein (TIGR00730 family)